MSSFTSPRRRTSLLALLVVALSACGHAGNDADHPYLDPGTDRAATISSLDKTLCNAHFVKAASFARFWVGTCRDRTVFEKPVYFMVFTTAAGKATYLERYEACVPGHYLQGPRWIALAVRDSDERVLTDAGAEPLPCTNTRLSPAATRGVGSRPSR